MPKPAKRKPLLYEGDIFVISGEFIRSLSVNRFELMEVEDTPKGKLLIVRKAEDYDPNN